MQTTLRANDWICVDGCAVRGQAFDDSTVLEGKRLAARFLEFDEERPLDSVSAIATELEGFYAAVLTTDETATLVADGARSIPIYYDADGTVVSDRGRVVRDTIGAQRDPIAESEFLLTRYVTGSETIWRDVHATQPGAVVTLENSTVTERTYRDYWPAGPSSEYAENSENPVTQLEPALEIALDRLERVAGDRPIVLPLSGGYDSRLLASALVARGRDVIAFTFGRSGHPDVEVSREVATRLGIRWEFVAYDEALWDEWYHSTRAKQYRARAFGGDALPFLAEVPALHRLLEEDRLPRDALFCPGHTVATPSERLPVFVGESDRSETETLVGCGPAVDATETPDRETIAPSTEALVDYVLETHYTLWEWDDEAFRTAARDRIRRGLLGDRDPDSIVDPARAAASYERWEWRGRMATFTNGDLRAYEDAGVDWWLPLWDPAYVRAWEQVPLEWRREKRAHAELAVDRYRRAAGVSYRRAAITDRSLSPVDRQLSLLRQTPARQFTERGGDWEPPFLAPQSAWGEPEQHPLAWYGAVDDELRRRLPPVQSFYAIRTLAETGRLDLSDAGSPVPETTVLSILTGCVD